MLDKRTSPIGPQETGSFLLKYMDNETECVVVYPKWVKLELFIFKQLVFNFTKIFVGTVHKFPYKLRVSNKLCQAFGMTENRLSNQTYVHVRDNLLGVLKPVSEGIRDCQNE